jgi:hypothetical protein
MGIDNSSFNHGRSSTYASIFKRSEQQLFADITNHGSPLRVLDQILGLYKITDSRIASPLLGSNWAVPATYYLARKAEQESSSPTKYIEFAHVWSDNASFRQW